jgi:hypothetical protein
VCIVVYTHTLAAISYPLALYTHTERVSFSFFNRLEGGELEGGGELKGDVGTTHI